MGFFSRIGNKAYSGLKAGTRIGIKALGNAQRIGNKVASVGNAVVSSVENSAFGPRLSKYTKIAKTGIGLIQGAADLAGKGHSALSQVDKITKAGEDALKPKSAMEKPKGKGGGGHIAHDLGAGLQQQKVSQRDISLGSDAPRGRRGGGGRG